MAADPRQDAERISQLMNAGEYAKAIKATARARKRFPKEAYFANLQGMVYVSAGQPLEAAKAFKMATQLRPQDLAFQKNYCQALISAGYPDTALERIKRLLAAHPKDADLFFLTALAHHQDGKFDDAAQAIEQAIAANPANPAAIRLSADILCDQNRFEAALVAYDRAAALAPQAVEVLLAKTTPLTRLNRGKEALETAQKCLTLAPMHQGVLLKYAVLLNEAGQKASARETLLRLLEIQPDNADAIALLVQLQTRDENLALQPRLQSVLQKLPHTDPSWPHIALALATITDQGGDYAGAGRLIKRANQIFSGQRRYDEAAAEAEFARMCALFPQAEKIPSGTPPKMPNPIFVIGLPRSGTTLTDRVISAHPGVFSGGELPMGPAIAEKLVRQDTVLEPALLDAVAREYLAGLPSNLGDHVALTDKLPANYRYAGLLLAAMPGARVVNLIRDPRDTALSMWRTYFPSRRMDYAFDLKAMADEANRYRRYAAFWHSVFPTRIHTLSYEDLVSDVETASRDLAGFCGLDWCPEMTAPEKNAAPIRTASVNQARSKVTRSSVGGWRRYATELAPFIAGLDPALWPEVDLEG